MQKYLLYNQGVKESGLPPKQEVVSSNLAGRTIKINHLRLIRGRVRVPRERK